MGLPRPSNVLGKKVAHNLGLLGFNNGLLWVELSVVLGYCRALQVVPCWGVYWIDRCDIWYRTQKGTLLEGPSIARTVRSQALWGVD